MLRLLEVSCENQERLPTAGTHDANSVNPASEQVLCGAYTHGVPAKLIDFFL